jgi:hypothetical protein
MRRRRAWEGEDKIEIVELYKYIGTAPVITCLDRWIQRGGVVHGVYLIEMLSQPYNHELEAGEHIICIVLDNIEN